MPVIELFARMPAQRPELKIQEGVDVSVPAL
jgi:hypothetical protein